MINLKLNSVQIILCYCVVKHLLLLKDKIINIGNVFNFYKSWTRFFQLFIDIDYLQFITLGKLADFGILENTKRYMQLSTYLWPIRKFAN